MITETRFLPSDKNSVFDTAISSIPEYVNQMRQIISESRLDLSPQHAEKIINANSPQFYDNPHSEHAIILVHGLLDSCSVMSSLYNSIQSAGMTVFSLLLPGHGTRPGDLLTTTLEEWLLAMQFAFNQLSHKKISIIGLSTGASLAILLAQQGYPIHKIVAFAPAIAATSKLAALLPAYKKLSSLNQKFLWHKQYEDLDYAKYQSVTVNAMYQVNRLMDKIKTNNKKRKLQQDLFMVLTSDDETICTKSALIFYQQQPNCANRTILYTNGTPLSSNQEIIQRPSQYTEHNILDFSHTGMTVSPSHPHYGITGNYNDFLHYQENNSIINPSNSIALGAANEKNLSNHTLKRLHYNPDYDNLIKDIIHFIKM